MNNYKETVNKFSEEQIRTILTQERPIDACRLLDCSIKIYYKLLNNLNIPKKGSSVLGLGMKKKSERRYQEIFEKYSEDEILTILNESGNARNFANKLGGTKRSYYKLHDYFYNKVLERFKIDEIRKISLNNTQEEACKILKCTPCSYQKIQDYLYEDIFKRFKEDEIISILQNNERKQACEKLGCSIRNYIKLDRFRLSKAVQSDPQAKKLSTKEVLEKYPEDKIIATLNESRNGREVMCKLGCTRKSYFELFNYFYNKIFENFKADEIRNIVLNNSQEEACKILKCTHYGYQKLQDYLYDDIFKRFKEDEIVSILQNNKRQQACDKLECSVRNYYKLLNRFRLSEVLSPDLQVKKEKKEEYEKVINAHSKEDLLKILTTNSPKDACSILKCRTSIYYQLLKEFNLPFQGKINYVNGMKRKHENKYNEVFKRFTEDQIKEILIKEDRYDACRLLNISGGIYHKLLKYFNLPTKVGQRRNTTLKYTDEQLIELYKKYNGNIARLVEEEGIERWWVIKDRLYKLGYKAIGNTESRPSWCKGLTKETSSGLRKISEKLKEGYKTGRLSNVNANLAQASNKTPSTEKRVMTILDKLNLIYTHQKPMGQLLPDFVIEDKKIVIQVQGCFWHRCPICFKDKFSKDELQEERLREIKQVKFFSKRRYRTLFIWEHELRNTEYVKSKILNFISLH